RLSRDWSSDVCSSDLAGRVVVRPDPVTVRVRGAFDVGGAITLTSAMVALIYGVVALGEDTDPVLGVAAFGAAAVLVAVFVAVERSEERRVGKGCETAW